MKTYDEIATECRQKTPVIPRNDGLNFAMTFPKTLRYDGRSSTTSLRGYMPAFKKI